LADSTEIEVDSNKTYTLFKSLFQYLPGGQQDRFWVLNGTGFSSFLGGH